MDTIESNALTILLIEDNMDHAELILRCLEEHKSANKVCSVTDGEAALHYLYGTNGFEDRRVYPLPELVLLDLRIPKIDGLQVLHQIKQDDALRQIPVVVLSSSDNEKDILTAYQNHVNGYVVKPLEYTEFTHLFKDIHCYWLRWNKSPH